MLAYFILLSVPIFIGLIPTTKPESKKRKQTIIISAFFFILFVLLALRSTKVGCDLEVYIPLFHTISKISVKKLLAFDTYESGYVCLNKFIALFSTNEHFFLGVIAAIALLPIAYMYCRESKNGLLTVLLFCASLFSMYFSGLRQIVAMGCMVPAYYATKNKKKFKFICCVLIACLFHQSAVVGFAFYPIYHLKLTQKSFPFLMIFFAVIIIFNESIFSFLTRFVDNKYEKYFSTGETGAYKFLLLLGLFVVYAYLVPDGKKMDKDTMGLRNILLVIFCFQIFGLSNFLASRMGFYYLVFLPIIIPKIIEKRRSDEAFFVDVSALIMILFFIAYFFYWAYTNEDIFEVVPYIPFWRG